MMIGRAIFPFVVVTGSLLAGCGKEEQPVGPVTSKPAIKAGGEAPHPAAVSAAAGTITTAELEMVGSGSGAAKAASSKRYRLVLIVKTRNNPFFDPMIKAFEFEAAKLGCAADVQAPPQETDKEQQFSLVQTVTARGADAILIAPADSKGIVPALKHAQDKGIMVINLDNRVDKAAAESGGLQLAGYVGADNEAGGKLAGEEMVRALGGKGKVAILEGIRGADNAEARKRGFESAAAGKLEVVAKDSANWDTQQAYAKFQSMFAAHKDIQGLFCANDKMALGAIKAIKEAGKQGQIKVIGYDNIPDVRPYLGSEMAATIEQHPDLMGKYGARLAYGILTRAVPKGKEYLVSLEVVTK